MKTPIFDRIVLMICHSLKATSFVTIHPLMICHSLTATSFVAIYPLMICHSLTATSFAAILPLMICHSLIATSFAAICPLIALISHPLIINLEILILVSYDYVIPVLLYSCSIKLQPLTVVFNSNVMVRLSEFLKPSHRSDFDMKTKSIEIKLQRMVMERYYDLKYSTKTEFIHSLDDLMIGESKVEILS